MMWGNLIIYFSGGTVKNINKIRKYIFDFFTTGHERSVKAKKNIIASFVLKAGSIAINLLLVPLTIHYINSTQYGIWLTLSSIINWLTFFDIGFGNGLRNKFAETVAKGQIKLARIYVSTTYGVLSIIIIIVLLLFFCINPIINWSKVLNTSDNMADELSILALIVFVFFCMQFVFQLISTIMSANQQTSMSSLMNFLGSLLSITIIYVLTKITSGKLIYLGIALGVSPVLVFGASSIWFYNTSYKAFAPSIKLINLKYGKELFKIGGAFFIIQIGAIILFQTDNIIITQLLGPNDVTIFNVVYKLFSVVIMILVIFITPFWSAFTDAYTKGDIKWIKNIFIKIKKIWILLFLFNILLFIFSPQLFRIWLGDMVSIPVSLSFAMTIYITILNWFTIHCYLLNGIGKIRLQLYLYLLGASLNIPICILLGKLFGLIGIILSNMLVIGCMGIFLAIQSKKILNNSARGIWNY
jgi:O-antigen/teichoic acid export membrane protein